MKRLLPLIFGVVLLFGNPNNAQASHIPSSNLTWTCDPNNPLCYTFVFTQVINCPSTNPTTQSSSYFSFTNSCGLTNPTMGTMTQVGTSYDVAQTCATATSTCNGGTVPGAWLATYEATVCFPANCDSWVIDYSLCCRDANSNTPSASSQDMHVQSVMNTLTAPCNNGPTITSSPIPYMCAGQNNTYCLTIADPDADSTYFQMTPPLGNSGLPMTFNAPYSANQPLQNFTLNPTTGCMTFNQPTTGNFVTAVLVESYDNNGNLISSIIHDYQFEIISCTNTPPNQPVGGGISNVSGTGSQTGLSNVEMCYGDNICFDVVFDDPNGANVLTISTDGTTLLPGATFTQTGTNPATGTFCWTAQPGFTGNVVTFNVEDDACPIVGTNSFSVNFQINSGVYAGADQYICGTQTAQLNASGASSYTWSPATGLSCTNCPNPTASPTTTTTYTLTGNLTGTCPNTDQVTVYAEFPYQLNASASPTVVCPSGCSQLDAFLANLPSPCCTYSIELYDTWGDGWNGGQVEIFVGGVSVAPPFTIASGNGPVVYNFSACNGDAITATYTGGSFQSENEYIIHDSNGGVIFQSGQGGATPSSGSAGNGSCSQVYNYGYSWSPATGLSDPNIANPQACGINSSTTYTVTAYDVSDPTCFTTETVVIDVSTINAGNDITICNGGATTLNATGISACGAGGTYSWSPGVGLSATNVANPTASPTITTTYTVTFTDGCGCTITDDVTVTVGVSTPPNMASTAESCAGNNDGTATGTAVGMTPGYTYSWNTNPVQTTQTATGLSPGNYTVTVTDANGCSANNSVNVAIGPTVTAGFTPPANQCLAGNSFTFSNTGTSGGGAIYNWNFGDGSGTSTQENPTYSYTTAGTYTVEQVITSGPCADTVTANITIHPMPTPTAIADSVLCNGDATGSATVNTPITPGPGPFSFSWNSTPVQTTNPASNLPAGTYTVTVTDQTTTCSGQVNVTIFEPPVLTAIENHINPSCNGFTDGTATANPSGGTTSYTYSWNTTPVQTTQTATGIAAGTYTCTITDANGCQTTVDATLTDPPGMVLNPTMTASNCGLSDGSANVSVSSGGTGPFTYSWNTTPVQTTQNATNISAGTYTVTVTDQGTGCTEDTSITVTTTAGITATATFISDVLCNGSADGQAYAAPTGGTGPYTYSWNTTPVQTNDTLTAGTGTYTVTITDFAGCTGTNQVTINEPTLVVASISSSNDVSCFGGSDGDATANGVGGTGNYTYNWNTTPIQNTQTATGLAPGNYTVTVTDDNNCLDTISVTIQDGSNVTSSIIGTNVSCFAGNNGSADLTVNGGTSPYTYNWTPSGSVSEDPTGLTAGTHFVTVTSQEGCTVSDSVVISEPTQLLAIIDSSFDVTCFGFSDGIIYGAASGGIPPYSYSWNDPTNQTSQTAINLSAGAYTLTVTDSNGCTTTVNTNINQPPALTATSGSFNAYCGLDQGSAWINPTNGTSPYIFAWDSVGNPLGNTDTLTNLYPGSYDILLEDANGCKYNTTVTVNAAPGGTASISSFTDVNCSGGNDGSATVSVGGAFPSYSYQWDAAAGNQTTNPATNLAAGTYNVSVTDSLGCVMPTSATIGEPSQLTLALNTSDNPCPDSCVAFIVALPNGGTTPYTYLWDDPATQINDTALNLCSGTYNVIITDGNGCTVNDSGSVTEPLPMVVGNTVNPANCNQADGSAYAFVSSNGSAPFTYEWYDGATLLSSNDSLNNIAAGTYSVIATDANGCNIVDTVTIPNLSGPSIAIDSVYHVQCFNGSNGYAEVQVTGGTFPYIYSWNTTPVQTTPSASNLTAGNYTVTATDSNGCVVSTAVTINEPTQLQLTAGGIDPTCFTYTDGSAWVNAFGGTSPYTYSWNTAPVQNNDSINGIGDGTYVATVIDTNGCFDTISVILRDPLLFSVNVTGYNVSCFGACDGSAITNLTNGNSPFNYQWDDPSAQTTDSVFGLCDTTVNVVVTDAMGCIANGSIVITEPNLLTVTENSHGDVSCSGGNDGFSSINVNGGTGPYNYNWTINTITVSTTQAANNLDAGSYLVVITDANGCTAQINITINEPNPLNANFSATDVGCYGASTGQAIVNANGGTTPYSYQWNDAGLQQTDTAFNLTVNNAPGYSVTVTDSLGCTYTVNSIIINQPAQIVLNTSTVSATCGQANGSATVSVGGGTPGYSYSWNTVPNQGTATANNVLAGNYIVTITDANGCVDSTTANIADLGSPTVTIPTSTDVSCNGANDGTAQSSVTGGVAPYFYSWNTNPIQTTPNATGLAGQTYSVTVTDSNGCIASESVTIIENSSLSAVINTSTNVSCNGGNDGDASVIGGGGGVPYTYSWNTTPMQTTATASNLIAGTYIVTISDTNNCTASDTVTITAPNILTVTSDSISNVSCNTGSDGYINVVVNGGTSGYSYIWTPNISNGATAAGLAAGNYDVLVTDANGCTANDSYIITEPNQLTINTSMTSETCGKLNGSASASINVNSTPGYTYQWNDPSNQATATATNLAASIYTVTVTDANGCFITENVTVTNIPGPIIDSVIVTAATCFGYNNGTATVYASGNGPFDYLWDDPFMQDVQTATGLLASPPLYTVTVTDNNGCESTAVAQISEPGQLTAVINSPDTVCFGESIQLFANANQGTQPYNYLWTGGNITGATGQGPHLESLTASTTYIVDVQDFAGCSAQYSKTIIVRSKPQFLVNDETICQGEIATLTPYNITGGNPNNPFNFFWMEIDSLNGNILSPTGIPNPTNPLSVSPVDTTDYIVWVDDGCSQIDTIGVTVFVNDTATGQLLPVIAVCEGFSQDFALTTINGVTFGWDFDSDGSIDQTTNSTTGTSTTSYTYNSSGTYDLTVHLTTAQGCPSVISETGWVNVNPNPIADFTTDPSPAIVTLLNPEFDFLDQSFDAITWNWDFDDQNQSIIQYPTHSYADTGFYQVELIVSNSYGCFDTIVNPVRVKPDFFFAIPNTFTPNGDGENDVFHPGSLVGAIENNYVFYIFDRWGELLFEGHDLTDAWDGTYKGNLVQSGTYIWLIEVMDKEGVQHNYNGHVNILK